MVLKVQLVELVANGSGANEGDGICSGVNGCSGNVLNIMC